MIFFGQKTKYGMQAMIFLSKQKINKPIPAYKIAGELKVPKEFMAKILQELVYKGLLNSQKGRRGGFYLSMNPSEIKIDRVFSALGFTNNINECLFETRELCEKEKCSFCYSWRMFISDFTFMIKNYSLNKIYEHTSYQVHG